VPGEWLARRPNRIAPRQEGKTALQVAGIRDGYLKARDRTAVRKCMFSLRPKLRTLVLQHPECLCVVGSLLPAG
jgi:hypothetical protein